MMSTQRLDGQIRFILEIDRLKSVLRQTLLADASRRENSAEHSWHLAMMAVVLSEYANEQVDLARVVKMALLHDVVEVDAGDTYIYDDVAALDKHEREQRAAERIFGLLPENQAKEMRELWDEFEARRTPESRFANALDRLQPVLLNYYTQGKAWRSHGVRVGQVIARNRHMEDGAAELWQHARRLIEDAANKGWLDGGV
jgi:putative hydrolases of HD superfamily